MKDLSQHLLKGLHLEAIEPGEHPQITDKAARVEDAPRKSELKKHTKALKKRLTTLQDAFRADGKRALLLVLQGRDAAGKDGTIRSVCGAFNPMGVQVAAFGPPSALEDKHDFLWRISQQVPPLGMIGVFNRSHYEDVLVVRVRKLKPRDVWEQRFEQINAFESRLASSGVIIRKCFLHISKDEQRVRLIDRLADPKKNLWDEYTEAYADAVSRCSTEVAPWYLVPSDRESVRNYLVTRMLVETLEGLDLAYPLIDPEVAKAAKGFE
jgi:PPK2 family polyphosphate:nucleotide phosphotransferase